jgi:hypothetical protein
MKVLNLRCSMQHDFEGWFASEEDFQSQRGRALVQCPMCGSDQVTKLPSAPRLNLGASAPKLPAPEAAAQTAAAKVLDADPQEIGQRRRDLHAAYLKAVRHVLANTEDVGDQFADQARRMHHGELQDRPIRGQTTREEAAALQEEGVPVMSLPIPAALKGPVH